MSDRSIGSTPAMASPVVPDSTGLRELQAQRTESGLLSLVGLLEDYDDYPQMGEVF